MSTYQLWIFILFFLNNALNAQHRCGADNISYPVSIQEIKQTKLRFEDWKLQKRSMDVITIPTHIIIVHNGEPIGQGTNLSRAHIDSQIDILNKDFRALNIEYNTVPSQFTKADCFIEFCLATIDPDGNPTDGITRIASDVDLGLNSSEVRNFKSNTIWDSQSYMNIWVSENTGGLLGYALIPSLTNGVNPLEDGIVCWTHAFGGPNFASDPIFNLGRTVTHEIGHYLGLNHVWGRNDSGSCTLDDGLSDTPIQFEPNYGCPNHPSVSCNNNGDMFMSFMDYVNDNCMAAFSEDQAEFMYMIMETVRTPMIGQNITKCTAPEFDPPILSLDTKIDLICFDDQLGFIQVDVTGGKAPYELFINNISNGSNLSFTNLSQGNYQIIVFDDLNISDTINTTITAPPQILLNATQGSPIVCSGEATGSFFIAGTGGTGILSYTIPGIQQNDPNTILTNLLANQYEIIATDQNDCSASIFVDILEPDPLVVQIVNQENSSCNDAIASGAVMLGASGGTPPYQYELNGEINTTGTFNNLHEGNYNVLATDQNNCESNINIDIVKDAPFTVEILGINGSKCDGNTGTVSLNIVNENNAEFIFSYASNSNNTGIFNNLPPGLLSINITGNNCSLIQNIDIPSYFSPVLNIEVSDSICENTEEGFIQIDVEQSNTILNFELEEEISNDGLFLNLAADAYTLHVFDTEFCDTTLSLEIETLEIASFISPDYTLECSNDTVTDFDYSLASDYILIDTETGQQIINAIHEGFYEVYDPECNTLISSFNVRPEETFQIVIINSNDAKCHDSADGNIIFTAIPTSGLYTYSVNDQTNNNGFFPNLSSGEYEVNVIDQNGCSNSIPFEILSPEPLEAEITTQFDSNWQDGTIEIMTNGGTPPYSYSLDGIHFQNEAIFSGLEFGVYEISIRDDNGCLLLINATIDFNSATEEATNQLYYFYDGENLTLNHVHSSKIERLYVYDINGRIVRKNTVLENLHLGQLTGGVYIIEFIISNQQHILKVFIP